MPLTVNWSKLREDFPILHQQVHGKPLIYLDNAASSQKPRAVLDAMQAYYEKDNANVHRGIHELSNRATAAYENARQRVATFLGAAAPEEIVFTRGTTESINLVAQSWGLANLHPGDVVLLTEMEHHSNLVPWQMIAQRTGATLAFIPVNGDEGALDLSRWPAWLTPQVKLLAFTHISNSMGTINPAAQLCAEARKRGIVTLLDAAQSAGHCPVNVQEIGCDFLAFSGHKVCGPTGIGVLYGRRELLDALPPYQGGGEMISTVKLEESLYKPAPHRFEAGTPNMAGAVGLHAALDYLDAIGRENIFAHDQELAQYAYLQLKEKISGIRLFGPTQQRAGLVSFALADAHAHDVVTMADREGVALRGGHHCNQPLMRKLKVPATARASFYFYNTKDEVDRLVEALGKVQRFFQRSAASA
jgi:cysteine desulfurase/selenocysteine lyase